MNCIVALAWKDLKLLVRDRLAFFFTLVWPLGLAVLFGTMYGGNRGESPRSIPIVIVDEDGTPASQSFVDSLRSTHELSVMLASRDEAIERVRRAKAVAFVVLKKGFGEASENPFWGESPEVEIGADPTRSPEAAMLEGILMKYASRRIQDFFRDQSNQRTELERARHQIRTSTDMPPGLRRSLENLFVSLDSLFDNEAFQASDTTSGQTGFRGFQPLSITRSETTIKRTGPPSAYAISFPQGAVWAFLAVSATFAVSIVHERTRGTLFRLLATPMTPFDILAGKALACFVATTGVVAGLFILGYFAFGIVPNSVWMLAAGIVSSGIAFVGLMMLLSTLGKTEQSVGGVSWGILIMLAMFGGAMIPLFVMPTWMRTLGTISPIKWSILAIEGAVWRNFTPVEMIKPCTILIAIGIATFGVGAKNVHLVTGGTVLAKGKKPATPERGE